MNHIFQGCRNVQQGETLLKSIRDMGITTGNVVVYQLNISVIESVKKFANQVKEDYQKIDYLINNGNNKRTSSKTKRLNPVFQLV